MSQRSSTEIIVSNSELIENFQQNYQFSQNIDIKNWKFQKIEPNKWVILLRNIPHLYLSEYEFALFFRKIHSNYPVAS